MLIVETIAKIRRMHHVQGKGFKTIARELRMSKNTVREVIKSGKTGKHYKRKEEYYRVLKKFKGVLEKRLEYDKKEPKRRRRTAKKLYDEICLEGYKGGYGAVNNFVQTWKRHNRIKETTAFVPLSFESGECFQFDWSEEEILLKGTLKKIKAAQIRLCHSRHFLVVAYPNEQLEMVMDAHNEAFKWFEGCCKKGIYDNMKTVINKILRGKDRDINSRFAEMASHYLFEPIACTPAAGWEKGQVENQVSTSRCNFFTPLVKVDNFEELNQKLKQLCLAWSQKTKHPEFKDCTVWEIYQQEKRRLLPYRYSFEGYKIEASVVSSCCLVNYETNAYSVECEYVYQGVELRIYAKEIIIVKGGKIIGEHERCFEKHKHIYNPWHYVPLLKRKPGALRNGAPFKDFTLPKAMQKIRIKLSSYANGDKEFIKLLLQVQEHGLDKVNYICSSVLLDGLCNVDLILQRLEKEPEQITKQQQLLSAPISVDCSCYDKQLLIQESRNE
jgi:transposase